MLLTFRLNFLPSFWKLANHILLLHHIPDLTKAYTPTYLYGMDDQVCFPSNRVKTFSINFHEFLAGFQRYILTNIFKKLMSHWNINWCEINKHCTSTRTETSPYCYFSICERSTWLSWVNMTIRCASHILTKMKSK